MQVGLPLTAATAPVCSMRRYPLLALRHIRSVDKHAATELARIQPFDNAAILARHAASVSSDPKPIEAAAKPVGTTSR